jgi:hypothetical protein
VTDPLPSDDELAAIVIALAVARAKPGNVASIDRPPAWTLSMRRPDLEFDDLLALRTCSTRF